MTETHAANSYSASRWVQAGCARTGNSLLSDGGQTGTGLRVGVVTRQPP